MKPYVRTSEDDALRRAVCDTILIGLCEDAAFGDQKTFAGWQRAHKKLLIGLFGGQGCVNLARLVAWMRRDAFQLRHDPAEWLCVLVDRLDAGEVPQDVDANLAALGVRSRADLLRAAMLDPALAKALLRPAITFHRQPNQAPGAAPPAVLDNI